MHEFNIDAHLDYQLYQHLSAEEESDRLYEEAWGNAIPCPVHGKDLLDERLNPITYMPEIYCTGINGCPNCGGSGPCDEGSDNVALDRCPGCGAALVNGQVKD